MICYRSRLVRPLRLAATGRTFAPRRETPAKNELQGTRMAATRIDCDIHPAVGGTRTTLLPVHIEVSYVIIET